MSSGGGSFLGQVGSTVGGGLSDLTGGSAVAETQGRIANAQLGQQQADRSLALQYAQPTALQMQQLQTAIEANNTQIDHSKQLLASVDPALMEAGKQALSLLQGKSAASLGPIQNQRAQQRQALQQTLAQQLGPDYATSTAGIQALNNFDQQTGNLMTNAQQQTLSQLLGSSQSSAALAQQGLGAGSSQAQNIINTQGGMQQRQIGAILGTAVDPGQAYAGQLAQNSSNATLSTLLGGQLIYGGAKMFGGSGGGGGGGGTTSGTPGNPGAGSLGSAQMVNEFAAMVK